MIRSLATELLPRIALALAITALINPLCQALLLAFPALAQ